MNKKYIKPGVIYTNRRGKYRKVLAIYNKSICINIPKVVYVEIIRRQPRGYFPYQEIKTGLLTLEYFAQWAYKKI